GGGSRKCAAGLELLSALAQSNPPCYGSAAMDPKAYFAHLHQETEALHEQGLFKRERVIEGPQGAAIRVQGGREVLNFCANNYLGLADHPRVAKAAKEGLDRHGYGMASVRFICGTQDVHKELEVRITRFL